MSDKVSAYSFVASFRFLLILGLHALTKLVYFSFCAWHYGFEFTKRNLPIILEEFGRGIVRALVSGGLALH